MNPALPFHDSRNLLARAASARAGPAVFCGSAALGYADLAATATAIAARLRGLGIAAGDRVAALFPNCHLYLAAYFAALDAGWVLVPLNTRLAERETRAVLAHAGARALVGDPNLVAPYLDGAGVGGGAEGALAGRVRVPDEAAAHRPAPGATHLYYTSGTTGRPKGVVLTRGNLEAHVRMTLAELSFTAGDVWLHAAPMFHLADAWAVWTATAAGAAHVLLPRYDPAAAFDLIETRRVTVTNLVPTMLIGLVHEAERRGRGLPSLRLMLSGGAPIAPSVVARVERALGCDYAQTYGLTETSPFLTFSLPAAGARTGTEGPDERLRRRARTGRAAAGVELRVATPPGAAARADVPRDDATVGEIVVRGATVTPGYWRDEEATRDAFPDGWFHTGDLGTIDAEGSVQLVDRAKDVIVTGGETVYSTEVENVLYEHPAVREAAVFAIPDDTWGEAVRAAVVLDGAAGATDADIIAFCRARLAGYKCPRGLTRLEALPRTGSGKIDKKALREPHWRGRERRIN